MKNPIGLVGRIATLALGAIFIEGMLTLGTAFNFNNYNAMAWIVQVLIASVVVWGACEWHDEVEHNR